MPKPALYRQVTDMTKFPPRYKKKGFKLPKTGKNYNLETDVESNPQAA